MKVKKVLIMLFCFFSFSLPCFAYDIESYMAENYPNQDYIVVKYTESEVMTSLGDRVYCVADDMLFTASGFSYSEEIRFFEDNIDVAGAWTFTIYPNDIAKYGYHMYFSSNVTYQSALNYFGENYPDYVDRFCSLSNVPPTMTPPVNIVGGVTEIMTILVPIVQQILIVACLVLCLMVLVRLLKRLQIFLRN